MEVLEDQDERFAARDPREGASQKLEDLDAVLGLLLLAGCGRARFTGDGRAQLRDLRQLREKGNQLRREVGKIRALPRGGGRVPGPKVVLDELAEALVREGAGLLNEAAVEDADLARQGQSLQFLEQTGLSDPGLAGHDRELAIAGDRCVQAPLELRKLPLAPDKRGDRRPRHHPARAQNDRHAELLRAQARPMTPERLGDLAGLLGPLGGILFEAAQNVVLQFLSNLHPERTRRLGDFVHDSVEDRLQLSGEGWIPYEALV